MTGSYRAKTRRALSHFWLFITRQSLIPVTPFIPEFLSENHLGYLGFLGYLGYFYIYPIYPKYPIYPYAILHSLFWYFPCVTRTISVDCTNLSIHFSIVLTLIPRTSACFTASYLVKTSFESVDEIRSPQEASRRIGFGSKLLLSTKKQGILIRNKN